MFKILERNLKTFNTILRYRYTPREIQLRELKQGYFADPNDVARRMIKVISLHDKVQNPNKISILSTWEELGVQPLTYVEIMLEVENEFSIEFADEDVERFRTIQDAVENVSKNFYTQ